MTINKLLGDNFKKVYIPEAVWDEVVNKGVGKSGSEEIKNATWIEIKKITNKDLVVALNEFLDIGEAEAITLAIENSRVRDRKTEVSGQKTEKKLNL